MEYDLRFLDDEGRLAQVMVIEAENDLSAVAIAEGHCAQRPVELWRHDLRILMLPDAGGPGIARPR